MKKMIFSVLILISWSTSLSAGIYHSPFGFTINISRYWFIMSRQVLKDNPHLFDVENEVFKNTDRALLNEVKNAVLSEEVEFYYHICTFGDNINVRKGTSRLPQTVFESKERCRRFPSELSRMFGKHIKVYDCGLRKVSGLNAFYLEADGIIDGTRSMMYHIQMSPDAIIIFAATCENQNLRIIKKEFEDIVSSIKIE